MARYRNKLLSVIFFVTLVTNGSKGVPRKWYDDLENSAYNSSYFDSYRRMKPYHLNDHVHTQRKILAKGNHGSNTEDVASRMDGKIIFPSDESDSRLQQFVPHPHPNCENSTFCETTSNYPSAFVEAALRMNKDLKLLSGGDSVPDIVHRNNFSPEDSSLCETEEKVVYPKVAQSKDKEWLFVVNHGDLVQGVRVETCQKENSNCNLIDGFAEGYKTMCKQKFIYRQLLAVSSVGQIKPKMFEFPASCCCHIKFTGNPLLRFGLTGKKSERPTSKVRRK